VRATRIGIEWDRHLPIFASERYLRLLGNEYGWIGGVDDSGNLACILPFVVVSKAVFRLVRFPVETILLDSSIDAEQEKRFLNGAVEHLRDLKVDLIVPATFNSLFRTVPDGALAAQYGNLVVDLTKSEDELWQAVHRKHRSVIRNAVREGVTIASGIEHLDTAYNLTSSSFLRSAPGFIGRSRIRARLNHAEFCRVAQGLGEYVQVLVAQHQGVAQCAAVIPFSGHSAYYMHGGSVAKPVLGASNLLQWEAMRRFRAMGVRRYNFFGARIDPPKGSKAEGIRKFKERFGGEFVSGFMWKYSFRRGKYALYELAAWARNGGDVVDQERKRQSTAEAEPVFAAESD
jgi:hypothetical protein